MKPLLLLSTCALLFSAPSSHAEDWTQGEIRRIDHANGTLTIKHEYIALIDMPPMTMVFSARPPSLLDGRQVGEKIRFVLDVQDGKFLVTRIEAAGTP